MFEYSKTLSKIEKLVDQLPYRSVEIRIEFPGGETATLSKEKQPRCGFSIDTKETP